MDVRIRLVLRIIDERAGILDISPAQLGELLGLGETRLLRLFNAEVGKTFRRYLRDVRMRRAAELLTNYALPIKTIASACGYSAATNFHRDFKLVHAITPVRMRFLQMSRNRTADRMYPQAPGSKDVRGSGHRFIAM